MQPESEHKVTRLGELEIAAIVEMMTDEQRLALFSNYCRYCGCNDPGCRCWDDS